MAFIGIVEESGATGELAELYASMVDPEHGRVDEILRIHGLHPAGLAAHWALYQAAMRPTAGLRKVEREMVALVVSRVNGCHY